MTATYNYHWLRRTMLLGLGVLLAACGTPAAGNSASVTATASGEQSQTSATNTKVRLGYVPVMVFAPVFVAKERGYFEAENLDVELTPVQGGTDSVIQLAADNFDAAVGGAGAGLFNAAARGVKFTIVASMHSEQPPVASPLVISAKRTGEIKTVADLRGKKVSINATGAATEYWLAEALKQNGMTLADVQLTTVAFRDVPAALESGSLDAGILGEPLTTINEDKGVVAVLDEDFINGFVATYLYMGEPLLKQPEAAQGFMRAYLRAMRDLQGTYMNQEIAAIIEKYTQVPAAISLRSALPRYDPNGRVPVEDLNTLQSYFLDRDVLEYDAPLAVEAFVNTTFAAEAATALDADSSEQ